MADTNQDSGGSSGGSSDSSKESSGGILDFVMQPLGMALLGGFGLAIAAGYFII